MRSNIFDLFPISVSQKGNKFFIPLISLNVTTSFLIKYYIIYYT